MNYIKKRSLGFKLAIAGIVVGALLLITTPATSFAGFGIPGGLFLPMILFFNLLDSLNLSNSPLYPFLMIFGVIFYYALLGTLISYVTYHFVINPLQKKPKHSKKKK